MDDCGIASPDMSEIDAFIHRLKAKGSELTKECDFSAYLGIKFSQESEEQQHHNDSTWSNQEYS